jgi:hypothetical protein
VRSLITVRVSAVMRDPVPRADAVERQFPMSAPPTVVPAPVAVAAAAGERSTWAT